MSILEWDEKDGAMLRSFLEKDSTGQKLVPYLLSLRPDIVTKDVLNSSSPTELTALNACKAEGWESCARQIEMLANDGRKALKEL